MLDGRAAKYETRRATAWCSTCLRPCGPTSATRAGRWSSPRARSRPTPPSPPASTASPCSACGRGAAATTDGGKVALPDWEYVALNDRLVVIAFDSDVMLKTSVHDALARLGALPRPPRRRRHLRLPARRRRRCQGRSRRLARRRQHRRTALLEMATTELRRPAGEPHRRRSRVDTFDDVPDEPGHRAARRRRQVPRPLRRLAAACNATPSCCGSRTPTPSTRSARHRGSTSAPPRSSAARPACSRLRQPARPPGPAHRVDERRLHVPPRRGALPDAARRRGRRHLRRQGRDKNHEDLRALDQRRAPPRRHCRTDGRRGRGDGAQGVRLLLPRSPSPASATSPTRSIDRSSSSSCAAGARRDGRAASGNAVSDPTPTRSPAASPPGPPPRRRLVEADPVMPDGITDRPADVWEPLLAVADAAGGDWPQTGRFACELQRRPRRATTTPASASTCSPTSDSVFDHSEDRAVPVHARRVARRPRRGAVGRLVRQADHAALARRQAQAVRHPPEGRAHRRRDTTRLRPCRLRGRMGEVPRPPR